MLPLCLRVQLMGSRAGEGLIYGLEEMSTVNESTLDRARQIAVKMVVTAGMCDDPALRNRTMTYPKVREVANPISLF